ASRAAADEPPPPEIKPGAWANVPEPSPAPTTPRASAAAQAGTAAFHDYSWQVLAVDAAGLAAGLAVAESGVVGNANHNPSKFGIVVSTMYFTGLVGAPPVHFAHRRDGVGGADLGFRLLVPPIGTLTGMLG